MLHQDISCDTLLSASNLMLQRNGSLPTEQCYSKVCALQSKIYQFFVHWSKRFNYPEIHGATSVISHINYRPFLGRINYLLFSKCCHHISTNRNLHFRTKCIFQTWVEKQYFFMAGNSTPFITPECFVTALSTSFEKWTTNTLQKVWFQLRLWMVIWKGCFNSHIPSGLAVSLLSVTSKVLEVGKDFSGWLDTAERKDKSWRTIKAYIHPARRWLSVKQRASCMP